MGYDSIGVGMDVESRECSFSKSVNGRNAEDTRKTRVMSRLKKGEKVRGRPGG